MNTFPIVPIKIPFFCFQKQEEEQRIALEKSKKSSNTPETSFPVAPLKTPIPNEVPPITTFGAYPNIPEVAPNNERVQPSAPPSYEPSSPQYHEPSPSYEPQLPPSYDQAMDYNTVSVAELKRDVPSIDRSSKPTITPEVNRDKKPQDAIFRQGWSRLFLQRYLSCQATAPFKIHSVKDKSCYFLKYDDL